MPLEIDRDDLASNGQQAPVSSTSLLLLLLSRWLSLTTPGWRDKQLPVRRGAARFRSAWHWKPDSRTGRGGQQFLAHLLANIISLKPRCILRTMMSDSRSADVLEMSRIFRRGELREAIWLELTRWARRTVRDHGRAQGRGRRRLEAEPGSHLPRPAGARRDGPRPTARPDGTRIYSLTESLANAPAAGPNAPTPVGVADGPGRGGRGTALIGLLLDRFAKDSGLRRRLARTEQRELTRAYPRASRRRSTNARGRRERWMSSPEGLPAVRRGLLSCSISPAKHVAPTRAALSPEGRMAGSTEPIVGREAELESVSRFLEDTGGEVRLLLLEGLNRGSGRRPSGGQASIWLEMQGTGSCGASRWRSRRRSPTPALGDLLGDALEETLDEMPEPQRRALEIALLRRGAARVTTRPARDRARVPPLTRGPRLDRARPRRGRRRAVAWSIVGTGARLRVPAPAPRREGPRVAPRRRGRPDRWTCALDAGGPDRSPPRLAIGISHSARLVHQRLGRTLPRPLAPRIHRAQGATRSSRRRSRGHSARRNPRAGSRSPSDELRDVLLARLGRLSAEAGTSLFASATARPMVETLADGSDEIAAGGLAEAVEAGIIEVDGDRVRFAHPLLASAVHWSAPDVDRRRAHARLAELAEEIEGRARHLALASDADYVQAATLVGAAADEAMRRGAPLAGPSCSSSRPTHSERGPRSSTTTWEARGREPLRRGNRLGRREI